MFADPAGGHAAVITTVRENGAGAIDWLVRAFGFWEVIRMSDNDGRIGHAELELGGGVIMLASATPDYQSPRRHREQCEPARAWSAVPWIIDGVMVQVSDADSHHQQARKAGAHILSEPEDKPFGRIYRAEDLEGHRWMFLQAAG